MNKKTFSEIGEFLHGKHWKAKLAKDLDVSERTIRHWANGDSPINDRVAREVWGLFDVKMEVGNKLKERNEK